MGYVAVQFRCISPKFEARHIGPKGNIIPVSGHPSSPSVYSQLVRCRMSDRYRSRSSVCSPADRSRCLVDEAENLILANVQVPIEISELCRALAVSERTLRKAFQKTRGLPPCRRLRMLRLSGARRVLLSAHGRCVTVTEIATSFGFVELGRFSVEYRKMFGESPSETLGRRSLTHRCRRSASRDRVGIVGSGISEMSSL